jgi:hypothetical protein
MTRREMRWFRYRIAAALVMVLFLAGCGGDGMDNQRQWCHERGGYIANTGWYEWKCIIDNTPVHMPSPRN